MAKKYSNKELQNMSNELTLPDGSIIQIPPISKPSSDTPIERNITINEREEFNTCCFGCPWGDNCQNSSTTYYGGDWVYPQADWCVPYDTGMETWGGVYFNYFIINGFIFIDGEESTNPLHCDDIPGRYVDCNAQCELSSECGGIDMWDEAIYDQPTGCLNGLCECTTSMHEKYFPGGPAQHYWDYGSSGGTCWGDCEEFPNKDFCDFRRWNFPTYSMDGFNNPSGNSDAIAVMWKKNIVGWEFVNNLMRISSTSGITTPVPGIMINIAIQTDSMEQMMGNICMPSAGDRIDDLLFYKASTGTYHKLTTQSRIKFLDAVRNSDPISGSGEISVVLIDGNLSFGESEGCVDCNWYGNNPDWNDDANMDDCIYWGKEYGCGWNTNLNICDCINQDAGCCPTINECEIDEDCRQGSICRGGTCILVPIEPSILDSPGCYCKPVDGCPIDKPEGYNESSLCNVCNMIQQEYESGGFNVQQASYFCNGNPDGTDMNSDVWSAWDAAYSNCEWECGERTKPKYSNKELQNMSVEELQRIKNQLQQGKEKTPISPQLDCDDCIGPICISCKNSY